MMAVATADSKRRAAEASNVFLLVESTFREAGAGPAIALADEAGAVVSFTLAVSRMVDRGSLRVSILGSENGVDWEPAPVVTLPRMQYCGSHVTAVDLARHPHVRYLRAVWTMSRWADDGRKPLFGFQITMGKAGFPRVRAAAAGISAAC